MQTVLLTGANGFVGQYLVEALLKRNVVVVATGRGNSKLEAANDHLLYEPLDFTHSVEVHQVIEKYKPQIIIHNGAMSKPDECEVNREAAFLSNVTSTVHLLNAAKSLKSFFIFLSTDFVFNGETGMYKEDDSRQPVNYYGETKLLAEDEVMKYEQDWAIVRTVLVYGKKGEGRHNLLTSTAAALQKGESLKIFDDQIRTPTYVEDLAWGIAEIASRRITGVYHLSGEDVKTPYQMAVAAANRLNLNAALITPVKEGEFVQPARRPQKTGFAVAKARQTLGYHPTPFEEGLRKTFG